MKRFKIVIIVIAIAVVHLGVASVFAEDKGKNKVMGYCFDAAFYQKTNRLFVAGSVMGMHVFDVTDGKLDFVTTVFDGGYHRNLKISGDRAYVADAIRGLVVYDISKNIPVMTWKQQSTDCKGMGICIQGKYAYLVLDTEGLNIFDISIPDSPELVGKCKTNGDAWDVWVGGKHAYIADLQKGITVIDVSLPSQPKKVSCVTWDENMPMAEIVRGEGKFVYVAAGKHGLVVIDVSNPQNPKVVGQYKSGPEGYGEGLCVRNGLVYLSNGNKNNKDENGLIIIDARNPNSLKVKGKCTFGDWVEGVCLANDHVFITNTNSGIRSVDISDPNNPQLVDSFGPSEEEKQSESDTFLKTEAGQQECQIIEYFEKTKKQILQGHKFNDQSTPANTFLTLLSGLIYGDDAVLEEAFPITKQFKKTLAPERRPNIIGTIKESIICRITVNNKPPKESDLSGIYTRELSQKETSQVWMFGYIEGSWRFLGSTSEILNWKPSAKQSEALTRNIWNSTKNQTNR